MHKIKVMSIPDLINAKDEINKEIHIIIQIHHTGENEYGEIRFSNTMKNIIFTFDDVNKGDKGFISNYDCGRVEGIMFSLKYMEDITLYICCYGGLSRSPAIALAICYLLVREGKNEYKDLIKDLLNKYQHHNVDVLNAIINKSY